MPDLTTINFDYLSAAFGISKAALPFVVPDTGTYDLHLTRGDYSFRIALLASVDSVWIDWRGLVRDETTGAISNSGARHHPDIDSFGTNATRVALTRAVSEIMDWNARNFNPFPMDIAGIPESKFRITGDAFLLDKTTKDPMSDPPQFGELVTGPDFVPTPYPEDILLLENGAPFLLENGNFMALESD